MKKLFILAAAMAVGLASCDKGPDGAKKSGETELKNFALRISTATPATRGTEGEVIDATGREVYFDAAQGVKIIISDIDGKVIDGFHKAVTEVRTGVYQTENMAEEVPANEDIYIFVFANDGASGAGKISVLPGEGDNLDEWMKTTFDVAEGTGALNDKLDIADGNTGGTDGGVVFLLGTMWKEGLRAPAGGTETDPTIVPVTIGRLSSKILFKGFTEDRTVIDNQDVDGAIAKGYFATPTWRIGTVALSMNYGGVVTTDGRLNPYETGAIVESALHTMLASPGSGGVGDVAPESFNDYDLEKVIPNTEFAFINPSETTGYYASEKTTGRTGTLNSQYYGNTTFIQVCTVYVPTKDETSYIDGELLKTGLPDSADDWEQGDTFYTAVQNKGLSSEQRLLFRTVPTDPTVLAKHKLSDVSIYEEGKNYHKFPVQDPNESNVVAKNRVLRNHYYSFSISTINDIGDWYDEVNPEQPIPEEDTVVKIEVEIGPWDEVEHGNIDL
jgi:hypothetical protein